MRCLLNALQSLVSLSMARNPPNITIISNHMKLFMSTAHLLHKSMGTIPSKSNSTKTVNDLVERLSKYELSTILSIFSLNDQLSVPQLKNSTRKTTKDNLRKQYLESGLKLPPSIKNKLDIQQVLFENILEKSLDQDKYTYENVRTENQDKIIYQDTSVLNGNLNTKTTASSLTRIKHHIVRLNKGAGTRKTGSASQQS